MDLLYRLLHRLLNHHLRHLHHLHHLDQGHNVVGFHHSMHRSQLLVAAMVAWTVARMVARMVKALNRHSKEQAGHTFAQRLKGNYLIGATE